MNLKITFTVLATLLISLASSYFIMTASGSDCNEEQNILQKQINLNKRLIFIIGSSQVGVLNQDFINKQVLAINPDFHVNKLVEGGDVPVRRLQDINQIVCAKPELVVYGIAFRDFSKFAIGNKKFLTFEESNKPPSPLPDPQIFFQNWFIEPFDKNLNPKALTLKFLKNSIEKFERELKTYSLVYPDESELAGTSNLIFYLRADESLHDFSRQGVDPTAIIGYPKYVDGVIGSALSFNATSILQIDAEKLQSDSDFNFNSNDQFSIAYWMKTDYQNKGKATVMTKAITVNSGGWAIYIDVNGKPNFRLTGTPNTNELLVMHNSEDIRDGNWRHFVWTYDGSKNSGKVSLYINGSQVQLESVKNNLSGSILNQYNVTIGAQGNYSLKLRAYLDDIRIYNDQLTLSEAQNLFEMEGISSKRKDSISNSGWLQLINIHQVFAEQIVQQEEEITNQEKDDAQIKEDEVTPISCNSSEICGPDELKSQPNLMKQAKLYAQIDPYTLEKNSKALKKVIKVLQDNDIKVVLFTIPHSEPILEQISDSDYALFHSTMQSISNEYNVPVYSLLENYRSMKIWQGTYHVTTSEEGIIYSEDVAKIILNELPK